ncbi:hypothetical protein RB653_006863 [Dictyostelium firmibasis]|uniref:LYR motif-containing protein 7 n=1 Tax=Dictyostelium firmibasis TaxID=79012 RepID=A0AAN7TMF3_9MYCE
MNRTKVLSSYLNLLRTEKKVFHNDRKALDHVMNLTRIQFRDNQNETDNTKINEMVEHANAVSHFLVKDLIQGVRKDDKVIQLKFDENTKSYQQYEFVNDQPPQRKKRGKIQIDEEPTTCCGGGCGKPMPSNNSEKTTCS